MVSPLSLLLRLGLAPLVVVINNARLASICIGTMVNQR